MANYITLIRTLLSFAVVAMLHVRTKWMYVAAFFLTVLLIWMDALDGYVARRRKETSKMGAVIDILGDRVVEMSYWIVFAKFGWVPLWVAILVSARGILVTWLAYASVYTTVVMCVVRGLPVVVEARHLVRR
jgi:CDP-diacylglycerol--glycerol-3-phosphate 3-phosphatidyltransferase